MGASSALLNTHDHTSAAADDPVSGIRPRPVLPVLQVEDDAPTSTLRVRAPLELNHLHAAFRAIVELGMRIVKAEVRTVGRDAIQTLHLLEADERTPTASRLSEAKAALRSIHGSSRMVASNQSRQRPRAKRLRAEGSDKWPR